MLRRSLPGDQPLTASSRLRAPYETLCKAIGNPVHRPKPGERVAWEVDIDGAKARIHAHADDRPVGFGVTSIFEAPMQVWRVEAENDEQMTWVCTKISERVIELVSKSTGPRTLSAEDKAEVNRLLKSGLSLSAAMKQVQTQSDDTQARKSYGWPVKDDGSFIGVVPFGAQPQPQHDDDDDDGEDRPPAPATTTPAPQAPAVAKAAVAKAAVPKPAPKVAAAMGPPIAKSVPKATLDAPYERLAALLGEPEDRPVQFVSTRWRFVLDTRRDRVLRWEDEPSDDPRDVDAFVFDRMTRFDKPYQAREAASATWVVTSSSQEHLDTVLTWLNEKLQP